MENLPTFGSYHAPILLDTLVPGNNNDHARLKLKGSGFLKKIYFL